MVPRRWAGELGGLVEGLVRECRWPKFAPLLAAVGEGSSLMLSTSFTSGDGGGGRAPRAFFLGQRQLEQISALSVGPELRTTNTMNINGTVLAAHHCLGEPQDVRGFLLLADPGAGGRLIGRVLALLDVSYPAANKVGLVVSRVGSSAPLALGHRGLLGDGGVLVLTLPGPLHSALGLCGCRPLGEPLEVHEADLRHGGLISRLGADGWAHGVLQGGQPGAAGSQGPLLQPLVPLPPRHTSAPAAAVLREVARAAGLRGREAEELWLGVPRGSAHDARRWRAAPGAGEWSLYRWSGTTAEGTAVLEGEGPAADGLAPKGLRCVQAFASRPDFEAVGRLVQAYQLERQAGGHAAPYAGLLLAGGPGAVASVADEGLFGGCALGTAVIGPAGLMLGQAGLQGTGAFSYSAARLRPTAVHRQAAGLAFFCAA